MTIKYPMAKLIGDRIKKLRKERGLTGADLAMILNVSQQQVSRYERGINRIDIDTLFSISSSFKIDMHYFLNELYNNTSSQNYIENKTISINETKIKY